MGNEHSTDIVDAVPLGKFRMFTPSVEFIPETLQQQYFLKTRDGLSGTAWIDGTAFIDTGLFIPNHQLAK